MVVVHVEVLTIRYRTLYPVAPETAVQFSVAEDAVIFAVLNPVGTLHGGASVVKVANEDQELV